jgi:hypothetical protein
MGVSLVFVFKLISLSKVSCRCPKSTDWILDTTPCALRDAVEAASLQQLPCRAHTGPPPGYKPAAGDGAAAQVPCYI